MFFSDQSGGTATLINWFNPGTGDATKAGAPTFTTLGGYASTTAGIYLHTGVQLQNLSQNSVHLSAWGTTINKAVSASDMGVIDGSSHGLTLNFWSNGSTSPAARCMSAATVNISNPTHYSGGTGHQYINRTISTGFDSGRNGYFDSTATDTSQTPSTTNEFTILTVSPGLAAGNGRVISVVLLCPGLTQAQILDNYGAVQTYMDGITYGEPTLNDAGFAPAAVTADALFLGCSAASVIGANVAARRGINAIIIGAEREATVTQIGGMPANGLSYIDIANFTSLGGLPRAMITWINGILGTSNANTQAGLSVSSQYWNYACRRMLDVTRTVTAPIGQAVPVYFSKKVTSVSYNAGTGLYTVVTGDGRTFTGSSFHDNTYSQESFDAIGVTYVSGKEANATYSETINGWEGSTQYVLPGNGISTTYRADPYITPGIPASGLIATVTVPPSLTVGAADPNGVQDQNFRIPMTTNVIFSGRWPTTPPTGYSAANYEALARVMALYTTMPLATAAGTTPTGLFFANAVSDAIVNTDFNSGQSSIPCTDLAGSGAAWVAVCTGASTQAQREIVYQNLVSFDKGLIYWILNSGDARIPSGLKTSMQAQLPIAQFMTDPYPGDAMNWPGISYVRECKRIVSTYVYQQSYLDKTPGSTPVSTNTIACQSYAIDGHSQRLVQFNDGTSDTIWQSGAVNNTNSIAQNTKSPFPVDAIVTPSTFAAGPGFSTATGFSASWVGYCTTRLEPTFMEIGQAQGEMANLRVTSAIDFRNPASYYTTLRTNILGGGDAVTPVLPQVN